MNIKIETVVSLVVSVMLLASMGVALAQPPSETPGTPNGTPPQNPPDDTPPSFTFVFQDKPPWAGGPGGPGGGGGGGEKEQGKGYKLMKGGVKIQNPPSNYVINPVNDEIDSNVVINEITTAVETWDENAGDNIHSYGGTTDTTGATFNTENGISFASIDGSGGTIARTTIWYSNKTKNVVEWDIVFDLDDNFGVDELDSGTFFDLRNIAVHEAGHTLVLEDLYEDKYSEMTMYGYSTYNETKKRTLEWGDSDGVNELY